VVSVHVPIAVPVRANVRQLPAKRKLLKNN
jgi:hypothetical protein